MKLAGKYISCRSANFLKNTPFNKLLFLHIYKLIICTPTKGFTENTELFL